MKERYQRKSSSEGSKEIFWNELAKINKISKKLTEEEKKMEINVYLVHLFLLLMLNKNEGQNLFEKNILLR
jgi:hypothetical protein